MMILVTSGQRSYSARTRVLEISGQDDKIKTFLVWEISR